MATVTELAENFLSSKKADPDLMELLAQVRKTLAAQGIPYSDFSNEVMRLQRENFKPKEPAPPPPPKEEVKQPTSHDTRKAAPVKPQASISKERKWTGPSILDMASAKKKN